MKNNYGNIPETLRKRRGERALITIWFGVPILLFGIFGVYKHCTANEFSFKGKPSNLFYTQQCGEQIKQDDCLFIVLGQDTIYATLSENQSKKYLQLVNFSDKTLNNELANIPKYDNSRIALAKAKDRIRKLKRIQDSITEIKLVYINNFIKSLSIDGKQIISYKSALIWGIILTIIGTLWIYVHLNFFIRDPYKIFKNK